MFSSLAFIAVLTAAAVAAPGRTPSGHQQVLGKVSNDLVKAELQAWKDTGKPDFVHFPDDNEQPVWAAIVGNQPDSSLHSVGGFLPSADDIKFHLFTKQ